MKNKVDVTKSVMERVTTFETKRTRLWLLVFLGIVGVVLLLFGIVAAETYGVLSERHTWDLLEIFYQDREIISEFWQDTLTVAWEEFPQQSLFICIGLGGILMSIFIATKRRRKIVARRFEELAKRQKNRNNRKNI